MKNITFLPVEEINKDSFLFKIEDLEIEKKYYFKIRNDNLSIFKLSDEPHIKVFLKALTYYLYKPLYNNLQIEPHIYKKYKADLISMNYSNEPIFWCQIFERDFQKIEYLCKHLNLDEFILVEINDYINKYINNLKEKIHYKYHHLIKIINFVPEIIYYVDSNDVMVIKDWYSVIDLND
jgi:hypothetical protein